MRGASALLVVSPNWLGDAVMALPAIADLRRISAHALCSSPRGSRRRPLCDDAAGRRGRRARVARPIVVASQRHADVAKLQSCAPTSASCSRIRLRRRGWSSARAFESDGDTQPICADRLLSRAVPRPAIRVHQAEYYQQLMKGLGIANGSARAALVVPPHSHERGARRCSARGVGRAVGRSSCWRRARRTAGAKRWPSNVVRRVTSQLTRS